jgi:phosphatidylserine/phosphatidylglycerophosphate/cardiolipin synthase-like enzyme
MLEVPDLVLIVVNKPVTELDPGAHGTHASHSTFEAMFGDRYLMLQLRTSDIMLEEGWIWDNYTLVTQDMDTHSKLRLVDDRYLSVGSCNWNNRGYLYEGELNVSVLDQDFVTDARSRIFQQLAGVAAPMLTGDLQQDIALIRELAQDNQDRLDWWTDNIEDMDLDEVESRWPVEGPQGFVFPLDFPDWYVLDAGPDAF